MGKDELEIQKLESELEIKKAKLKKLKAECKSSKLKVYSKSGRTMTRVSLCLDEITSIKLERTGAAEITTRGDFKFSLVPNEEALKIVDFLRRDLCQNFLSPYIRN